MLKALEKRAKHLLISLLRILFHSSPVSIPPPDTIKRILVVRQHNQLGDMLCVVPLLRGLRERFPSAYIALVASPANVEVVLNNRYLDEVINFDKREFLSKRRLHVGKLITFLKNLRRQHFDVAIVPSTVSLSFTSHLLAYLSKAPVRIGAGSIDGRENPSSFLLNTMVDLDWRSTPHRHQTLRNLDVTKPIGVHTETLVVELTLTEQEIEEGKRKYVKEKGTSTLAIGFHPGAGKKLNCWQAERFASVANQLSKEFAATVFVTAGPMDNVEINQMIAGLEVPYYLMKNLPLRFVASIISNITLFISNDTGLMHVSAAVGVPVLSLFGPTDPQQWAPIGSRHRYVVSKDGSMSSISIEEVLETARGMLCAR